MSAPLHLCPRCGTPLAASGLPCPVCALDAALDLGDSAAPETEDGAWDDLLIPVPPPLSGEKKRFGRFDLLGEVGRGGMGVVYRAKEENSPRVVALKIILPHSASVPGMIERFRAEAGAVASLDHPHILPLYASGEREGLPFFSMKLAGGGSLASKLREFDGHPPEAARLIASIAHAVHHAHQRGILHRDLKPANILLDEQGVPYVADFGIAKWIGQDQSMTMTGVTLGTPTYMAPEQAAGKSDELTVAADVYSLGAILYEMLAQRPPFWAHTTLDLLRQVADQPPPTLRSIRPEIPRDLETICLKCLAKEPEGRYASAGALAADLEAWLDDRPIAARPMGRVEKAARLIRRNPALAILSAIVLALLIAAVIGTGLALKRIAHERNEAMTQLRASLLAQARAAQLSGLIGQRFESLEALKKATALFPGLDLRDEALAAMALPDARLAISWNSRYASNSPVAFDSTGERFVVESGSGRLTLHRTSDGALLREFTVEPKHPRAIYIAPLAPDDSRFAVRFEDDRVAVYSVDKEKPLWQLTARPVCQINPVMAYDFAFTPDSREVAVGVPGGGLSFHDAATGRETSRLKCAFAPVVVAFSPDGKRTALAELRTRELIIFVRATGKEERRLTQAKSVIHAAWSPDGKQIAVACFDNRIYLWDAATGTQNSVLRGHAETPTLLAWRGDSRVLASTGRDVTLRLWDSEDGTPLLVLPRFPGNPASVLPETAAAWALPGKEPLWAGWICIWTTSAPSGFTDRRVTTSAPGAGWT